MEALVKELLATLQEKLGDVDPGLNTLMTYGTKIAITQWAIGKLNRIPEKEPFPNKSIEIMYFKHWCPPIYKLRTLYMLLLELEQARVEALDKQEMINYLKKKSKRINRFFKKHKDLRIYHLLGQTDIDEKLFVSFPTMKKEEWLTNSPFYCESSIWLGKILAFEEFLPILSNELKEAIGADQVVGSENRVSKASFKKYKWKPNKAQTAEIIYSLAKMRCIEVNGHDAEIIDISTFFREVFAFDIGNVYDVERYNRKRKKDKAPYLRAMIEAYLNTE